ncbi:MAG: hypothetical protein RL150_614 [Candidatus Parcubacteria bacterium]
MQTISTRSLISLLVLTAFITTTIAPTAASAQRGGAGVVKAPTASITIGGQQNHTATTGEAVPAIVWRGTGTGATFETTLKVNNPALCGGIKDGQVWGQGKTAAGNFKLGDAPKAREGCVLGFVYQVTDKLGRKATDRATLRYVAPKVTAPEPTTNTGGNTSTGGNGTTPTSTPAGPQAKLKLLTPNGGERWMSSSENIITWTPEPHRDGMVAYLEKKSGSSFQTIGKVIESQKGSIRWYGDIEVGGQAVMPEPGSGYYIRIVDTKTGATDRSDKPFEILSKDTFKVNLRPGDDENNYKISQATNVELMWSASALGQRETDVSCTLYIYDNAGNEIEVENVGVTGTKTVTAQMPIDGRNDGLYTLAHLYCRSPFGHRSDNVNIVGREAQALSVTYRGRSTLTPGSDVPFTFTGTSLNVPNKITASLYPSTTGIKVDYGNIGQSTFERAAERGTLLAPQQAGQYRITLCDDNTPSPEVPFKPLCAHSDYFTVNPLLNSLLALITPVSMSTQIETTGNDDQKGVYTIEFDLDVTETLYIPNSVGEVLPNGGTSAANGISYSINGKNGAFWGTQSGFIVDAAYSDGTPVNKVQAAQHSPTEHWKVDSGRGSVRFTVQIELNPEGQGEGGQYGITLEALQVKNATQIARAAGYPSTIAFNKSAFETKKITIASAVPVGEITQTVAQGAAGDDVSRVQAALKRAGLFNEEITGYFGSITRAAVKAFQREHALENVGAVGPKTMSLMNQLLGK